MKFFAALLLACSCRASDVASWYAPRVAGMVCASYDYPIGSTLRVTDAHNGFWVVVRVIERGPNHRLHRRVDLCPAAFLHMNGLELGLAEVRIERIK